MKFTYRRLGVVSGLLGVLLLSGLPVLRRAFDREVSEGQVIRIAHTFLQPGVREGLAEVMREYERRQAARGVKVHLVQIPIPLEYYNRWVRTQLIGGVPPDIVQNDRNLDLPSVSRYLMPLGAEINRPNPWNAGTALADQAWRATFLDDLEVGGFIFELAEHYGVPVSISTTRLFVNLALLRQVLDDPANAALRDRLGGTAGFPKRVSDWASLCEAARRFRLPGGDRLIAIAGSSFHAPLIFDTLLSAQTERLRMDWAELHDWRLRPEETLMGIAQGKFSLDDPAWREGLRLIHQFGTYMQAGFAQQQREDASLLFAQGRALMIAAPAWDVRSFREFIGDQLEVTAFPLPAPSPGDPPGSQALGEVSEAAVPPAGTLAVVNAEGSKRRDLALDFLRFLTSIEGQRIFIADSGWLPAVREVAPPPASAVFMPKLDGYPGGPNLLFGDPDLTGLFHTDLHLLVADQGGVEQFSQAFDPAYHQAIPGALHRVMRAMDASVKSQDAQIAARWWLSRFAADSGTRATQRRKLDGLIDSSLPNDANLVSQRERLARLGLNATP